MITEKNKFKKQHILGESPKARGKKVMLLETETHRVGKYWAIVVEGAAWYWLTTAFHGLKDIAKRSVSVHNKEHGHTYFGYGKNIYLINRGQSKQGVHEYGYGNLNYIYA